MILQPPEPAWRYRQEIGEAACPGCGTRPLMYAGVFLCARCTALVPRSFLLEAGRQAGNLRSAVSRRHYRTARIACIVAARLGLSE